MTRFAAIAALLAATACAPVDISTRGAGSPAAISYAPAYTLSGVEVNVPHELSVSEADRFYPIADIVWRGDAPGDRHEQVASIFRDGAAAAARSLTEGPRVTARIEVRRFHSLSEKARMLTGGVHDMEFQLTLVDAATGAVVYGPREMHAALDAHGGATAIAAERRGETMRVRIVEHIAGVLRGEMSRPVQARAAAPVTDARAAASF